MGLLEPRGRPGPVHGQKGPVGRALSHERTRLAGRSPPRRRGCGWTSCWPRACPGLSRRRARVLIDLGGVFIDRHRVKIAGRPVRAGEKIVAHLGGALARAENKVGTAARAADERRLPPFTRRPRGPGHHRGRQARGPADRAHARERSQQPAGAAAAPGARGRAGRGRVPGAPAGPADQRPGGVRPQRRGAEGAVRALPHARPRTRLPGASWPGAFPARITSVDQPDRTAPGAHAHRRCEERFGARATLLRCTLETGRTHQIRHPLPHRWATRCWATSATASAPPSIRRAWPCTPPAWASPTRITGAPLAFDSPWPADLTPWLDGLRRYSPGDLPRTGLKTWWVMVPAASGVRPMGVSWRVFTLP